MTYAYTENLGKNPANHQPLTPLGFLARAAQVFPNHPAVVHGATAYSYAEFYTRARQLASALWKLGIGKNDTVSVMLPNMPAMLEAKYGVPMAGAVLNSINTRLDAAIIAFMLDHAETKVLITDPRIFAGHRRGADAAQGEAARHRLRRSGIHRARRAPVGTWNTKSSSRRRPGLRLADAGRRVGRDRAQLHLGHHRRSQGRRLSPSRRLSARARQRRSPAAWASIRSICGRCRCSIATAGASPGRCRSSPAPMSACARCAPAPIFDAIADPQGHASVRRADRDVDAAQRAGGREEAAAARGRVRHRRGAAAGGGAGGDEGGRLQRHPCLRADRDLRSGQRQRLARRMGRARRREQAAEEGAPGRALSGARRRSTCSIRRPCSRCRATARRSAR